MIGRNRVKTGIKPDNLIYLGFLSGMKTKIDSRKKSNKN
jgi:hypothetical protein